VQTRRPRRHTRSSDIIRTVTGTVVSRTNGTRDEIIITIVVIERETPDGIGTGWSAKKYWLATRVRVPENVP